MKNLKYFIFSRMDEDLSIDIKYNSAMDLHYRFNLHLNRTGCVRLFGQDVADGLRIENVHIFNAYVVSVNEEEFCPSIQNGKYYDDCSRIMLNFIKGHRNCICSASEHRNRVIKALIFGGSDIEGDSDSSVKIRKLYGENGWNSLEEYFTVLKEAAIPYVVLRKYENLPNGFIDGDKDIDVLCMDQMEFVNVSNAVKRSFGISGYKVRVGNEDIPLDIRFLGDNYFDSCWECSMIMNRHYEKNTIAVMSGVNMFFSIIYHVYTQKKYVSTYYIDVLDSLYKEIFGNDKKEIDYFGLLTEFMKFNNYKCVKPLDWSVVQNKKFIRKLKHSYIPLALKLKLINMVSRLPKVPGFLVNILGRI